MFKNYNEKFSDRSVGMICADTPVFGVKTNLCLSIKY